MEWMAFVAAQYRMHRAKMGAANAMGDLWEAGTNPDVYQLRQMDCSPPVKRMFSVNKAVWALCQNAIRLQCGVNVIEFQWSLLCWTEVAAILEPLWETFVK